MANKTIIQLPAASTLYPDDVLPIMQLGVATRHISASQLGITPVATILAMTSASSANALAHSLTFTRASLSGALSNLEVNDFYGSLNGNWVLNGSEQIAGITDVWGAESDANAYTDAASANIMSFIGALPPSGATLAQVAAASGNALTQANAYTDAEIAGIDLSSYALVTSLQTTAGNLQAQINTKADSSALSSYALTTVAAAMSANALTQANAFSTAGTQSASADIMTYIGAMPGGVTLAQVSSASGNALVHSQAYTDSEIASIDLSSYALVTSLQTTAGNLQAQIATKIDASALTPYALVTSVQTTAGNLVAQIATKADTSALASYALTSVAAAMSANSLVHANAFTTTASGNIMTVIGTLGGGVTLAQVSAASGNSLTHSKAYTDAVSASLSNIIATSSGTSGAYLKLTGGTVNGDVKIYGEFLPTRSVSTSSNIVIGPDSLKNISTGSYNTAVGNSALLNVTTGSYNVAVGQSAGGSIGSAQYNVCIGPFAGHNTIMGAGNIAIGYEALNGAPTSLTKCVGIGFRAGSSLTQSNRLVIHNDASTSQAISSESLIYGEFDTGKLYNKGNRVVTSVPLSGYEMLDRPSIIAPRERVMALGNVSGSFVIPLSAANYFTLTLTSSGTATFIAPPENLLAQTVTVMVSQVGTNNPLTFTNSKWAGGTASTLTSGGLDMLNFVTYDGGTTYIGVSSLKDIK